MRWQKHNEARRQVIIDAAVHVLETNPAGDEIHVQQIADQAKLSRTVVYRHFQDRADLDLAVQQEICELAGEALLPALLLEGSPRDIIRRVVNAFALWALDHPALLRFVERDLPGSAVKPLDAEIEQIATQVEEIINGFVAVLGAELPQQERAALAPWVFGLVGGVFQAVRHWMARGALVPSPDEFVDMMSETIWYQIRGLAETREIDLPDEPIEHLLDRLAGNHADGAS